MKNKYLIVLTLALLLIIPMSSAMIIPSSDKAKEVAQCTEHSKAISENGDGEWELDSFEFIHYAKPPWAGGGDKGTKCFKLLGVKWKDFPVDYTINPTNSQSLSESFITDTLSASAEIWDDATSKELLNDIYIIDYTAQYGVQDFENTLEFGNYPNEGVIAVTTIWFTRKGRQIVEFDILFNEQFAWGDADIDPNLMDLKNIAVHELGHGMGLDDIYSTSCTDVTMYGYSTEGETSKITLESADITGLQKMYGV